jgi:uncharacterized protein YyaL (SSP411 family)
MPNRLAKESSPYLLQHKDNPVDWWPWGEEAFEKAREEDKPIFLSIGYSTCHWCHVMEEESFEDEEVAELLNETFVPIKVDREERPDVDSIYMTVCQMMRGQGGWPLTVLLTPDRRPFYAATYLPKQGRFQQMGMMDLIPRVQQLWEGEREKLLEDADEVTSLLQRSVDESGGGEAPDDDALDTARRQLTQQFDRQHGGFGNSPKFPSPHNLLFLLREWHRTGDDRPLEMVTHTLDRMRLGGIFDHLGGGFHRYSTDSHWLLPHFEKMLYDQAMHVMAYAEGYQITGKDEYADTASDVLDYVLGDMRAPEGGFYSAEDADSPNEEGENEEGAFYVWSTDEVREELWDEELAELVIDVYNLQEDGNYAEESTRQKTGKNILHLQQPLSEIAEEKEMSEERLRERLDEARLYLWEAREVRPHPHRDDKVLTDWNGLMIAALAVAARTLDVDDTDRYEDAATDAASFLLDEMRDEEGRLLHRYRMGEVGIRAHLDDYAFLIWGLIELYQTTFEVRWLRAAAELTEECIEHFWDEDRGGFYLAAADGEELIVRQKEATDGALPSGNSVMLRNLLRLAHMTGRTEWEETAEALHAWAGKQVNSQPGSFTALLMGTQFALGDPREVVIAGTREKRTTQELLDVVRSLYTPNTVVLHRPPNRGDETPAITEVAPYTEAQTAGPNRAAAFVCRNFSCDAPTSDADELHEQLKK